MPQSREYSLDEAAAAFALSCGRAEQRKIVRVCEFLRDHHDTDGDFHRGDSIGRTLRIKVLPPFVFHFWDDFADRRVRIVRIERMN